jgi:hypothetical protein
MSIDRTLVARLAFAALTLGSVTPAFAGHVIVYDPRTDASSYSATHQGPNVAGSSSHYVNGNADPGNFVSSGGTISGGGSVAQTTAQSAQNGGTNNGDPLHNDAFAAANLVNGTLKATTASTGPNNFGTPMGISSARLDDTLWFTNTTGSTQTISFTYRFDGQLFDPLGGNPGGSVSLGLSCGGNTFGCNNGPNGTGDSILFATATGTPLSLYGGPRKPEDSWNYYFGTTSSCFGENGYCGQYSSSLWEYGLNAPNADGVVDGYIRAYLNIPTGETSLGVRGVLNIDCRGGSSCDFGHTGTFGFGDLPTGLSYSSASGFFLTANTHPGAVPEPATWAMMLLGFGAIGTTMRYRRRNTSMSFA